MKRRRPERSEGSLGPMHRALRSREKALVRRVERFFASLRMTEPKYGVEYGDRSVSMSEAARRAVEKLAARA